MKRFFSMAALVALAAGGGATQATAATATAALDTNSAYVWRGLTFNDGFVVQPSVDVSANGFALNVWANYDLDDYNGLVEENQFSEVDLTASYAFKLGAVDASVGIVEYTFPTTYPTANEGAPKAVKNTAEVFAGLAYDLGRGFVVSTKLYYDIDEVNDFYVTGGLGYSYSINDKTTLGLSGLISYAGEDFSAFYAPDSTDGGFFNYMLTASVKYMATEAFGITASINYTDSMDDNVLPDTNVDTTFFGGVSLTYTF
ncbi:MAG: MltA-interacting MipA family protein [Desulfobulbaceae bacterium]|nr:MltA-interacting MipA family protein [Desulfobulbaceae bacterium]